jgi:hypothetical protein
MLTRSKHYVSRSGLPSFTSFTAFGCLCVTSPLGCSSAGAPQAAPGAPIADDAGGAPARPPVAGGGVNGGRGSTADGGGGKGTGVNVLDENSIAALALANVGEGACSTNSLGGNGFESSCWGNGGLPEYWCADFAMWVWANEGADVSGLSAAAGSFYVYGQNHGTLQDTPCLGCAVVFNYQGGGVADHVAVVTQVNDDGTIESVSGDFNGQAGTEAEFASTSSVVLNSPAYASAVGAAPWQLGNDPISGYVRPWSQNEGGNGGGGNGVGRAAGKCTSDEYDAQLQGTTGTSFWVCQASSRYICDGQYNKIVEDCPQGCAPQGYQLDDQCNGSGAPQCSSDEFNIQLQGTAGTSFWVCEGSGRYICDGLDDKVTEACPNGCTPQGYQLDDQCN